MFINKTSDGKNNICGAKISELRTNLKISQRELADRLQIIGLDVDKNAIQRIEAGKRFVTDIEIIAFAKIFDISPNELLGID
ncbi:MAG: helix-turn-helix transcriptional regulator [Lachnospiraceae bacterium]|nr:helix-turn-helix transcriptional regulator [Lachnospiraceae bacterium]